MTPEYFSRAIAMEVKQAKSVDGACEYLERSGFPPELVAQGRRLYESEVERISVMQRPSALRQRERRDWYPGPDERDMFWPALRRHLTDVKRWDARVIRDVDDASTRVVSLLAPPGQATFATRGLVLGYVQSGKTANFTAVISKAADAGYRLFIVLSGLHNALRRQTQERLDAELVELNKKSWFRLTGVENDFTDRIGNAVAHLSKPQDRLLAVLKKNPAPLQKMLRWLKSAGKELLRDCPVLVIDDEADQASLNTRAIDDEFSRINALIVQLLGMFPRCAYVGYTATPFANVLSDPTWPDGLYPRDFIVDLPEPQAYFGARRIFGSAVDHEERGLNVIRVIPDTDAELVMPKSRGERDTFQPTVTDSLREALRWFWMAAAIRLARGQGNEHMGMLIHTTVYTDVHERFQPLVESEQASMTLHLQNRQPELMEELRTLWDREIAAVDAEEMRERPVSWGQMLEQLPEALRKTRVVVDNARSDDRLEYPKTGGSIQIVIGGNTLSRGLTIEGLMVSYFMRATTYYDTLMQMGRWFGYRFGYSDLPRLWLTADLKDHFQHLVMVEQEIREDIARYSREDITPLDVGVNIQMHSTMAVTSELKMAHAITARMTFARAVKQTTYFKHLDRDWLESNTRAARALLAAAHRHSKPEKVWKRHILYRDVDVSFVRQFLEGYRIHERHQDMRPDLILGYIRAQAEQKQLLRWNIGVVSQAPGKKTKSWDGLLPEGAPITLLTRSRMEGAGDANLKAIMSPVDRAIDFGFPDAPKLTHFADWAKEQKLDVPEGTTFVDWCLDHRSPIGPKQDLSIVKPDRGLRTPLLLLYPIDRESDPDYKPDAAKAKQPRARLDAVEHVVGLAIVFPQTSRNTPQDYVTVDLSNVAREEPELDEDTSS
jgi:hypothetical protein